MRFRSRGPTYLLTNPRLRQIRSMNSVTKTILNLEGEFRALDLAFTLVDPSSCMRNPSDDVCLWTY